MEIIQCVTHPILVTRSLLLSMVQRAAWGEGNSFRWGVMRRLAFRLMTFSVSIKQSKTVVIKKIFLTYNFSFRAETCRHHYVMMYKY